MQKKFSRIFFEALKQIGPEGGDSCDVCIFEIRQFPIEADGWPDVRRVVDCWKQMIKSLGDGAGYKQRLNGWIRVMRIGSVSHDDPVAMPGEQKRLP